VLLKSGILWKVSGSLVAAAVFGVAGIAMAEESSPPDQKTQLADLCLKELDIGTSACACFADHSLAELDDNQRTFLILSATDAEAAKKMPLANSTEDVNAVALFIGRTVSVCTTPPDADMDPPPPDSGPDDEPEPAGPAPQ
jgi:hypothetical protein